MQNLTTRFHEATTKLATIHWHWLWMHGESEATWVLCGLTAILCIGVFLTAKSMGWSKKQQNLQTMSARFNANDMLFARAAAATQMLNPNLSNIMGHPPPHARKVIAFLMQTEQMLRRRELRLDDVVIQFGDHIMVYGDKFKRLGDEQNQGRYKSFITLYAKTMKSKRFRQFQSDLDTYFDKDFWECEAHLK